MHTPGPWEISANRQNLVAGPNGHAIADCKFSHSSAKRQLPTPEECIDNARLIAAAPELLEACMTVAEWFRKERAGSGTDRSTPEGEAAWREWWEEQLSLCARSEAQATAAIAKATGR